MARAMSSGSPRRRSGTSWAILSRSAGSAKWNSILVLVAPGHTVLTRTPKGQGVHQGKYGTHPQKHGADVHIHLPIPVVDAGFVSRPSEIDDAGFVSQQNF